MMLQRRERHVADIVLHLAGVLSGDLFVHAEQGQNACENPMSLINFSRQFRPASVRVR